MSEILRELDVEGLRSIFLKYTRKAFESIPERDKPRILDIGCGTGMPTLELAKLSNGEVTGIDIDQGALDKLNLKIKQEGLSGRVKVYNRPVYDTKFEATNWANRKIKHFPKFGFKLIKQIPWEKECWWTQYYSPLEEKINILRKKYDNFDDIEEIKLHVMEIEMVKKNPNEFDCVFYIFQKIN